jgi:PAS domain S-box-containing protein
MLNAKVKSEEQELAEASVQGFQEALGPFVVAAEATRMPMVFTDARIADNPMIFANDSFLSLTGYDRAEVLGRNINSLMARNDDRESLIQIQAAFEGSEKDPEVRYRRKDGSVFWATVFVSPVRNESGDIVQHFISFVDVTQQKREGDRLRFLLDELNHRTQNTLATVQAIAVQTLRGLADNEVVTTFEGRILALSKAHSLLGRENWDAVSLQEVINKILQPFGLSDPLVTRFSVEGDDIRLQSKSALTLAMVFHELATNAAKHGALSDGFSGHIEIAWRVEPNPEADRMWLRWKESGGPPVVPPRSQGFGSRLIEGGLAQDLNAEVTVAYEHAGVICQIVMPIPQVGLERNNE